MSASECHYFALNLARIGYKTAVRFSATNILEHMTSVGKLLAFFCAVQALALGFVFSGALWNKDILAPIDIAPAFFSKYRFVDPDSTGVPRNHYPIDQLVYDLPLQKTIHAAYRRGEIPWWDPYTLGGRPFIAEGHVSATDPVRVLLYLILPFESAYNWVRVFHSILSGIGMLLLLRHFRFPPARSVLLALAYEFGGCFVVQFAHPWVHASYVYYPFLWCVWDVWFHSQSKWCLAAGPVLTGAVLYAGNLQSHSYLGVFAPAFCFGYAGFRRCDWLKVAPIVAWSGIGGAMLAAPMVLSGLEAYFITFREGSRPFPKLHLFGGLASLSGIFPWVLGTFRTVDLSKFAGQTFSFGFSVFVGSVAFALAILGVLSTSHAEQHKRVRRTALYLLALYFIIVSTPLVQFLYLRSAGLAVLALVVLAALGVESALRDSRWCAKLGSVGLVFVVLLGLSLNIFAFLVYPKLQGLLTDAFGDRSRSHVGEASALRDFQVRQLPREISFWNPEVAIAWLGLAATGMLLRTPALRRKESLWCALLALNLVPQLFFADRFIPQHEISKWRRLLQGGPEQQRAKALLANTSLRLYDSPTTWDKLMPFAMSHLYGIRVLHGYAALPPPTVSDQQVEPNRWADYVYHADQTDEQGVLERTYSRMPVRFQWQSRDRPVDVVEDLMNQVSLHIAPGPTGTLLWADTYYPGWRVTWGGESKSMEPVPPAFSQTRIPGDITDIQLKYQPRYLSVGIVLAVIATLAILVLLCRRSPTGRSPFSAVA